MTRAPTPPIRAPLCGDRGPSVRFPWTSRRQPAAGHWPDPLPARAHLPKLAARSFVLNISQRTRERSHLACSRACSRACASVARRGRFRLTRATQGRRSPLHGGRCSKLCATCPGTGTSAVVGLARGWGGGVVQVVQVVQVVSPVYSRSLARAFAHRTANKCNHGPPPTSPPLLYILTPATTLPYPTLHPTPTQRNLP